MTSIRVLIVDDEPLARETLQLSLSGDPEVAVVGSCSGAEAAAVVARTRPDIMFLDVQMPEVGGFDLVQAIGPGAVPVIVFVTAYDQYALRAFEVHALDYLLKPFDDRRFQETLRRAKDHLRSHRSRAVEERLLDLLEEREKAARPHVRRFVVRERDRSVFVAASAVDWIEAADDYVVLHAGAETHLVRERLVELEKRLDPEQFARIHRSTIVNIERVRELHPLFRGDSILVLADGTRLRLSRSRRGEFERRLHLRTSTV
ncbi:MAG TPA: LytTR family DNA-binding domain-containing protein [Candidatus Acidoferrum sp.]|nr:LytTR family DNA-binding domain-containing protein [Candidatus Acidoferrum sp.]